MDTALLGIHAVLLLALIAWCAWTRRRERLGRVGSLEFGALCAVAALLVLGSPLSLYVAGE